MRLRILSDLNLEFGVDGIADDVACDVVVLAGDIHTRTRAPRWASETFRRRTVVYVPGNHEYCGSVIAEETAALAAACRTYEIAWLAPGELWIHGVRFIGATLWTDYALRGDPGAGMAAAASRMNDHRAIRDHGGLSEFTPARAKQLHSIERAWLAERIASAWPGPTVVVTHHAPSSRSIATQYADDTLSGAFASNLDSVVESSGAAVWVHGHTHGSADYRLGATQVVANPRGYPERDGGFENPSFNPELVIDL